MKRILLLGDIDEAGGTGTYFKRAIEFLGSRFELHVALRKGQETRELLSVIAAGPCSVSIYFRWFGRLEHLVAKVLSRLGFGLPYSYLRDSFLIFRLRKVVKPDLIFVSQGGGLRFFPALLVPLPVIIVNHSLFAAPLVDELWAYSYLKRFDRTRPDGKLLLFMSNFAESQFKRNIRSRVLASLSAVVPNYGSITAMSDRADGEVRILTMGHVVEYKNPRLWIEVARILNRRYPGRLSWTWAGVGPLYAECRNLTREDPRIRFVGFRRDVSALYSHCDIYFQPSIWESQGISVVEAMGSSLPCVVSSAGGLPESVRNGEEGFVCEPNAVDQYVDAIARLIEDEALRLSMGKEARARFVSAFSRDEWVGKMEAAISSMMR